jgi:hypothetical protein
MRRLDREYTQLSLMPAHRDAPVLEQHPVTHIEIGQLFRKMDMLVSIWQVVASFEDGSGVRHARLRNVADESVVKLISESALRNPKFFRRVAMASADPE